MATTTDGRRRWKARSCSDVVAHHTRVHVEENRRASLANLDGAEAHESFTIAMTTAEAAISEPDDHGAETTETRAEPAARKGLARASQRQAAAPPPVLADRYEYPRAARRGWHGRRVSRARQAARARHRHQARHRLARRHARTPPDARGAGAGAALTSQRRRRVRRRRPPTGTACSSRWSWSRA